MVTVLTHSMVVSDSQLLGGEPVIESTKTPVRAIVELWRLGVRPEEIPTHLPHLNLAQVFGALSYYSDHQEEINRYIELNRVPDHLVHPAVKALTSLPISTWTKRTRSVWFSQSQTLRIAPLEITVMGNHLDTNLDLIIAA